MIPEVSASIHASFVRSTEPYYEDTTRHFIACALKEGDRLPGSSNELIARVNEIANTSPETAESAR